MKPLRQSHFVKIEIMEMEMALKTSQTLSLSENGNDWK
jgi:hypothetical protein